MCAMYASILVALDGSDCAHAAGRIALGAARELGCGVLGTHVYAAQLHSERFRAMEPGLPPESQGEETLGRLRETHDSFISDGLHALSRGYLEQFLSEARSAGVAAEEMHLEGRNYVRLLELARERGIGLIALGARGLGALDDGLLGSTAARVLRQAPCDVLIARRPLAGGAIVAGIDGSDYAQAIVRKAAVWARVSGGKLRLAAAYDPAFHVHVFETMARSLPPERQEEVGLQKQEALHEGLINDGLAALYRGFLDRAFQGLGSDGCPAERVLLEGKAYRALAEHAEGSGAGLIVVTPSPRIDPGVVRGSIRQ